MAKEIIDDRTVTIASGQSLSDAVIVKKGFTISGILMPSAWTAANITLYGTLDGSNYYLICGTDGNAVTITSPTVDRFYMFGEELGALFAFYRGIKLYSSNSQAADRTITIILSNV
jgi:hypothetical protein